MRCRRRVAGHPLPLLVSILLWTGCGGPGPETYAAAVAEGRRLIEVGELEAAVEHLDRLRRSQPDEIDAYGLLTTAALRLERPEDAIPALEERVARGGAGEARARLLLAQLLERADRRLEAAQQLEEALRIDPDYAAAYRELSRVYARAGDIHRGMALAREGLERHPSNHRLRWWLGDALMRRERWREAEVELLEAIAGESAAAPHYSLGLVYLHTGRLQEAAGHLESAAELEPASAEAWYQLAHVRERLGETAARDRALERFAAVYRRQLEEETSETQRLPAGFGR